MLSQTKTLTTQTHIHSNHFSFVKNTSKHSKEYNGLNCKLKVNKDWQTMFQSLRVNFWDVRFNTIHFTNTVSCLAPADHVIKRLRCISLRCTILFRYDSQLLNRNKRAMMALGCSPEYHWNQIISKSVHRFSRRSRLKLFSIYSPGGHFVQQSKTV